MFPNPHISLELARGRQRDLIAQAEQYRLARHVRAATAGAEHRPQPRQHLRRAVRVILRTAPEG
jgi:hypothetical protein